MKKLLLLSVLIAVLSSSTCNKAMVAVPPCIQTKINEIKMQAKWNPPAQVDEYLYNGKRVFLFTSDCCDQYNTAYDVECNVVCAPSGGITGKGDGKCADFAANAKHIRLVWKDER
jgi:hypothetical protein